MGITIVQRSDLKVARPKAPKGLVLAGGALTGAAFKIGGLKALNDYMRNFDIRRFDIFLGISSGSLLATALSGGLSPEEMFKSFDGSSKKFSKLQPWHFYWPNWEEFLSRPLRFSFKALTWLPSVVWRLTTRLPEAQKGVKNMLAGFLKNPSIPSYEALWEVVEEEALGDLAFPSLLECFPSGLFDNAPLERYLRQNIRRNGMTNNFKRAYTMGGKKLYITAMTLDGAQEEVFGPDERNDVPISKAVQASTAMPGFYKPVKIGEHYFVDGGVKETANLDLVVAKGAKLIIAYNPFRPFEQKAFLENLKSGKEKRGRSLTEEGVFAVLNQFFRTIFHTRLHNALKMYEKIPDFDGDIILIEPRADDALFFSLNPFDISHRLRAATLGFDSVRNSIEENYGRMEPILRAYGIRMSRQGVEDEYQKMHGRIPDPVAVQQVFKTRKERRHVPQTKRRSDGADRV